MKTNVKYRPQMAWVKCAAVAVALWVCVAAQAAGSGTVVVQGRSIALMDGCAYRADGHTTVVLSDKPLDAARIASGGRFGVSDHATKQNAVGVEFDIDAQGRVESAKVWEPGKPGALSKSGGGWYKLDLARNDDKRIEGSLRSTDDAEKTNTRLGLWLDVKFAGDLVGQGK